VKYNFSEPLEPGKYLYRIKQTDESGNSFYSDVRMVNLDEAKTFNVNVFPNPFHSGFNIMVTAEFDSPGKLVIYNHLGQPVLYKSCDLLEGSNRINLDAKGLLPGIYYLELTSGLQKKVVIIDKLSDN
jgi:hypothetical protein